MPQVGVQDARDEVGAILRLDAVEELASDAGIRTEAAADEDVEALERVFAGLIDRHARLSGGRLERGALDL